MKFTIGVLFFLLSTAVAVDSTNWGTIDSTAMMDEANDNNYDDEFDADELVQQKMSSSYNDYEIEEKQQKLVFASDSTNTNIIDYIEVDQDPDVEFFSEEEDYYPGVIDDYYPEEEENYYPGTIDDYYPEEEEDYYPGENDDYSEEEDYSYEDTAVFNEDYHDDFQDTNRGQNENDLVQELIIDEEDDRDNMMMSPRSQYNDKNVEHDSSGFIVGSNPLVKYDGDLYDEGQTFGASGLNDVDYSSEDDDAEGLEFFSIDEEEEEESSPRSQHLNEIVGAFGGIGNFGSNGGVDNEYESASYDEEEEDDLDKILELEDNDTEGLEFFSVDYEEEDSEDDDTEGSEFFSSDNEEEASEEDGTEGSEFFFIDEEEEEESKNNADSMMTSRSQNNDVERDDLDKFILDSEEDDTEFFSMHIGEVDSEGDNTEGSEFFFIDEEEEEERSPRSQNSNEIGGAFGGIGNFGSNGGSSNEDSEDDDTQGLEFFSIDDEEEENKDADSMMSSRSENNGNDVEYDSAGYIVGSNPLIDYNDQMDDEEDVDDNDEDLEFFILDSVEDDDDDSLESGSKTVQEVNDNKKEGVILHSHPDYDEEDVDEDEEELEFFIVDSEEDDDDDSLDWESNTVQEVNDNNKEDVILNSHPDYDEVMNSLENHMQILDDETDEEDNKSGEEEQEDNQSKEDIIDDDDPSYHDLSFFDDGLIMDEDVASRSVGSGDKKNITDDKKESRDFLIIFASLTAMFAVLLLGTLIRKSNRRRKLDQHQLEDEFFRYPTGVIPSYSDV